MARMFKLYELTALAEVLRHAIYTNGDRELRICSECGRCQHEQCPCDNDE